MQKRLSLRWIHFVYLATLLVCDLSSGYALANDEMHRVIGKLLVRDEGGELKPLAGALISQTTSDERAVYFKRVIEDSGHCVTVALSKDGFSKEIVVIEEGDAIKIECEDCGFNECGLVIADSKVKLPTTGGGPGPHGFLFRGMVTARSNYLIVYADRTSKTAVPSKILQLYVQGQKNRATVSDVDGRFELTKIGNGEYFFRIYKPGVGRFLAEEPRSLSHKGLVRIQNDALEDDLENRVLDVRDIVVKRKLPPVKN